MKRAACALLVLAGCAERAIEVPESLAPRECDRSVPLEDLCANPPRDETLPAPVVVPTVSSLQTAHASCNDSSSAQLSPDWSNASTAAIGGYWPTADFTELMLDGAGTATVYKTAAFGDLMTSFARDGTVSANTKHAALAIAHDRVVALEVVSGSLVALHGGTAVWDHALAGTWASLARVDAGMPQFLPYAPYDTAVDRVLIGPYSTVGQGIAAFDAASGELSWTRSLALPYSTIAADENGFYLDQVSPDGGRCLVALDQCGEARWVHVLGPSHSVLGIAVNAGHLYGFDDWVRSTGDGHAIAGLALTMPVVDGNRGYGIIDQSFTNILVAFDLDRGVLRWARSFPDGYQISSALQLTEDGGVMFAIYAPSGDISELRALSPDGDDAWSCRLRYGQPISYTLDGASVYVAEASEQLSRYTPPGMPRAATKGWVRWGGGPQQGRHGL